MIIPIVSIPVSIADGLSFYEDLFPRSETFEHIQQYCTGVVVLEKPSILRMSHCFVDGPSQSSLNKAITTSPWSCEALNQRRHELIRTNHQNGFSVGILDSTFIHHPRGQSIYGVYKYFDYVEGCYTYAIQLVTAAISTNDRVDGFDYRIYHRSFERQERLYLEHTDIDEPKRETYLQRLMELLCYKRNRLEAKTKSELAVELIDAMEATAFAPNAYALDSSLFAPEVIQRLEHYKKPWVADSKKNRILTYKGQCYNCETFEQTLHDDAFREITLTIRKSQRTYWVFTCCVRIRRYGKVRLAIIYDNPQRKGEPLYVFTKMIFWNAKKILSVRLHRWDIEPLHEQIKQFLGAEDSQLQTEEGVRKHLTLVFVVNSLLQSLDLSSPIGDLSMQWPLDVIPTFGQRCRRIILEVFSDLISKIHEFLKQKNKTVSEIFQTLFRRLIYV
jgi:SRSO17 transposase